MAPVIGQPAPGFRLLDGGGHPVGPHEVQASAVVLRVIEYAHGKPRAKVEYDGPVQTPIHIVFRHPPHDPLAEPDREVPALAERVAVVESEVFTVLAPHAAWRSEVVPRPMPALAPGTIVAAALPGARVHTTGAASTIRPLS